MTRPRPRRALSRLLTALLVLRLEAREIAPLSAGMILLNWLRRPVIEMPLAMLEGNSRRRATLTRRLNAVYPF
ncbi:MAG: hypothetical protein HOE86_04350, partial [Gemmatimonadetes bacterium]|nr:hypothetical protein [Gemmatimonadota bacterium]